MAKIRLLNYSAKEMTYKNNIQANTTVELSNRCRYNLGFTNGNLCRGEMMMEVFNKNDPDNFYLKVTVVGNFVCEEDAPKDDVHRTSYKVLFPHAKAMVTAITVTANVPPLFFPDIDIDSQSIYVVENPKK
jgi:preprotein translocase subunit SecB